jgi:hypothetical protein
MQWSIGFSKGNIEHIIREKNCSIPFKWMPLKDHIVSMADPFLIKDNHGNLALLYEEFSVVKTENYGKIKLSILDEEYGVTSTKILFDTKSHSSYPFVFIENNITYIIPETSAQKKVSVYEYNFENKCLINERIIISNMSLLDSTIIRHNNKYWLFSTKSVNEYDYSSLYIYYSDNLFGPYFSHAQNPVKNNPDGSRSAGSILKVDGELYRPAQNCGQHYGESIAINKISVLTETEFSEEIYFRIAPDKHSEFKSGIHTINNLDGIIVIDGIKMVFNPFVKWKLYLKRKLLKKKCYY